MNTQNSNEDRKYMRLAISEAKKAVGRTTPNPSVGCVIVNNGKVISKGCTQLSGVPHAEVDALDKCTASKEGATMYVTLEPCDHEGKSPPCTGSIISSGIKRVVIANKDYNEEVNGKGIEKLKQSGIQCDVGVLAEEALQVNLPFFLSQIKHKPFVTVKAAVSMDGKIALSTGNSKWISGETARKYAHMLRYRHDAVMVGANTVVWDDPELTCRISGLEQYSPVRVILDSELKTPSYSKIMKDEKARTIFFSAKEPPEERVLSENVEIVTVDLDNKKRLNLNTILKELSERGLNRLIVEGGGKVITSLLMNNLVDEIHVIKSPRIFGDDGLPFIGAMGLEEITRSMYYLADTEKLGDDIALIFKNRNTEQFASELI